MCIFLHDLNVNQGVTRAKLFQNPFCKWSEMLNFHVSEKMFFLENKILEQLNFSFPNRYSIRS